MIDADSDYVKFWDPETYEQQESKRKYVEATEGLEFNYTYGDYYKTTERKRVDLYLDPLTGLVVFDVPAYEKWLEDRGEDI